MGHESDLHINAQAARHRDQSTATDAFVVRVSGDNKYGAAANSRLIAGRGPHQEMLQATEHGATHEINLASRNDIHRPTFGASRAN
jgi:hypothetical protein